MRHEQYSHFLAGCFGGACGVLVGHPLDTIKTWQQASNSNVFTATKQIYVRNNGIKGFYRGMFFPFVTTGAINSILFGVYGNHMRQLRRVCHSDYQREQLEYKHMFLAGSIAGFVQSFIACPIELVKVRLQTQFYYNEYVMGQRRTPFNTFKRILKSDGISGIYRGLLPMMCRDVFPYGIYMLAYRHTTKFLDSTPFVQQRREGRKKDESQVDLIVTTLAGAWAGILSWVCVIPFDVVKTIMQAEENRQYRSTRHCLVVNFRRYGMRSLFRGSWMLVVRAIPVNAATFLGYEYALEWGQKYRDFYM
ncbi:solute carrier family 25 member 45 isoform X1 [Glossina fuscipes]|uniref:Solute carrier family 25 member 45 isoform X1 n=3 Tax=Glossina TaxID=7393 RepID=A0A9C6DMH2_9MUSC|nr:solute carrier family 25 member 45 isoform X1 [Glossina fuscipes]XP_037893913.1 solute carrier family 25 member 45 isoform X1 [Glossina fuscipes]